MAERCRAETKRGTRCTATPVPGDDRCAWHTTLPAWVEKRRQWSSRGGAGRSNKARAAKALPAAAMTPAELQAFLIGTMQGTRAGTVDKGIANAVANLARTIAAL